MQYMLVHAIEEGHELGPDQAAEIESSLGKWLEEAIGQKVDLHGSRLCPSTDATTVRVRAGETLVTDGPFVETKEQVAGYDILECSTLDEAVEWASKHPTAQLGSIEVRPLMGDAIGMLAEPKPGTTRYLMLVCVPEDVHIEPDEEAAIGPATGAWVNEMGRRGARLVGQQLEEAGRARTVRVSEGQVLVTDGPFAETKELIAGFDILECSDLDEAIEVAAKHPMASFGSLELRPFWPVP